jgi:hypothetical protein
MSKPTVNPPPQIIPPIPAVTPGKPAATTGLGSPGISVPVVGKPGK